LDTLSKTGFLGTMLIAWCTFYQRFTLNMSLMVVIFEVSKKHELDARVSCTQIAVVNAFKLQMP